MRKAPSGRGEDIPGSSKDEAATLLVLTKRRVEKIEKLLDLPDEVKQAIDDPDMPFAATHGVVLQQAGTACSQRRS